MSIEQRHGSASSLLSSEEASKRFKCRKSRDLIQLRRQSSSLDIVLVIGQTPQAAQYII